jgi:hypothetical protein
MMKKIILFMALSLFFTSCDIGGNDNTDYVLNIVPVSEVTMPTAYAKDSITNIPVKYIRPTSCHFFDSFYYEKTDFTRTIAIYCAQSLQGNCQADNVTSVEVNLPFKPTQLGVYHFKFLTGQDANNVPQFLEFDVTVDH